MANEKRLIYMDDTMDRLRAYADRKHQAGHTELANGILKAVNYIHNEISRVDAVEVVHGRWALIEEGQNTSVYQCSKCKRMVNVVCDRNLRERQLAKNYPYCNCGAKMDEESTSQ